MKILGTDCSVVATCPNNCTDHGVCIDFNVCRCSVGYTGEQCNEFSCEDVNFCTDQGQCVGFDSCLCNGGRSAMNVNSVHVIDMNLIPYMQHCISYHCVVFNSVTLICYTLANQVGQVQLVHCQTALHLIVVPTMVTAQDQHNVLVCLAKQELTVVKICLALICRTAMGMGFVKY